MFRCGLFLLSALMTTSMPLSASEVSDCADGRETVVLLHGLLRSAASMRVMETALTEAGYDVINIDYPSRDHAVEALVPMVFDGLESRLKDAQCQTHFVTHSMGGILLRAFLGQHEAPGLGRVVMLGPPNQGSEVVDKLSGLGLFQWMNGPAGSQLGTGEKSLPQQLGEVDFELGVIAGNRSINWILSMLIPGEDDGKVAVERTRIKGMKDFIVMPHTHVFMMRRPPVIRQTLQFLRHGEFDHNEDLS